MNSLKVTTSQTRLQRTDLLHLLDHSQAFALTLILAPAGSGKSTLLQQWRLQHPTHIISHLALTRQDADPVVFLRHLYQSLKQHVNILAMLSFNALDTTPEQTDVLAQSLLEAFNSLDQELFLILDDFHYASSAITQQLLAQLLSALPAHIHIIIASRSHPSFSLSRLKLDDQLLMIDSHDLKLPTAQFNEFCQLLQQPQLSSHEHEELLRLTEGWMAGIKLALLARAKTGQLLPQHFQGTQPEVVDYFIDVVLAELPPSLREFLLASSIFEKFSPKVTQYLLPHLDSQSLIQSLIQKGLFISALDEQTQIYRYHPLFKHCLQVRLQQEPESYVQHLHHRAADYFLATHEPESALAHAQLFSVAEDFYPILEQCCAQWLKEGKLHLILSWLNQLSQQVRIEYAQLALLHLSALIFSRLFDAALYQLHALKSHYAHHAPPHILETLAFLENTFSLFYQDNYLPEKAIFQIENKQQYGDIRDAALTFLARYTMLHGECETAIRYATYGKMLLTQLGHDYLSSFSDVILILSERELGHILVSRQMTQDFFDRYAKQPQTPCWVNAATCMVVSLYEQNRCAEASALCEQLMVEMDSACVTELVFHVYVTLARLQPRSGLHRATQLLTQLRRILRHGQHHRLLNQLLVQELSLAMYHQHKELIKSVVQEYNLIEQIQQGTWQQTPASYQEAWIYSGIAAALYLRSRKQYDKALAILALLDESLSKTQMRTRLTVVKANKIVILSLQSQQEAADYLLRELFTHFGLQCAIRTVFDEAPDFARLVREGHEQGIITLPELYIERYRDVLYPSMPSTLTTKTATDTLTQKEHEVLTLVQKGLSNKEICQKLSISLSTTKWHVKNIFGKLQISNRASAVAVSLQKRVITPSTNTFITTVTSFLLYADQTIRQFLGLLWVV